MEADSMLIGSALDYYGLIGARGGSFLFLRGRSRREISVRNQGYFLDMIAIYSTNRYEYDAVILGGYQANITNVALYDTLGLVFISY